MTNPAIDRERETEHFSTQMIFGARPPLIPGELEQEITFTPDTPILLDDSKYFRHVSLRDNEGSRPATDETFTCTCVRCKCRSQQSLLQNDIKTYRHIANETSFTTLDGLTRQYPATQVTEIQAITLANETTAQALERIAQRVVDAVRNGSRLVILNDADAFLDSNGWVDPILVLGVVDRALRLSFVENSPGTSPTPIPLSDKGKIDLGLVASNPKVNLRRQAGIVIRSGAIRNLHDLIMCLGMGADAIVPYLIFEATLNDADFDS